MTAVKWTGFLGSSYDARSLNTYTDSFRKHEEAYLGKGLDLSAVARSTLAGEETKRTVTGGFVLEG